MRIKKTYSSDCLHAQDEGVLGQVARVAEGVLLPQLAKQILHAAHAPEVVGEVALEERVDAAAQHEPHHDRHVRVAGVGPCPHQDRVGDAEDNSAPRREHAEQLNRVELIGHVTHDLYTERVVWVQRRCRGGVEGHGDAIEVSATRRCVEVKSDSQRGHLGERGSGPDLS